MLQKSCRLRKLAQQALQMAPALTQDFAVAPVTSTSYRSFANLPNDYANVKVVMPIRAARKAEPSTQQSLAEGQVSASGASPGTSSSATLQQGAQAGDHKQNNSIQFCGWLNKLDATLHPPDR